MEQQAKKQFLRSRWGVVVLLILLCGTALLSLRFGSSAMDSAAFLGALTGRAGYETQSFILASIRLPRVLAGLLAGAGLSVAGVLLQGVTGNDLASPNIIGVNAGAGFAMICFLFFFPTAFHIMPLAAFLGAFLTTLLILGVAKRVGALKSTVILAGIACTSMLSAGISFITLLDEDVLASYNYFSIGGFAGVKPERLAVPAVIILLSVGVALGFSRRIDLLCLGDSMAVSLGVRVRPLRTLCLLCASAAAAAVVSYAGLLGFVGLIVPHMARRLVGGSTLHLLVTSTLLGGILVTAADLLGRTLFAPSELPVGIVMALLGAPFFFWLLLKRRADI